jgi:hypothetical protein
MMAENETDDGVIHIMKPAEEIWRANPAEYYPHTT